jgi:hypothetical protein
MKRSALLSLCCLVLTALFLNGCIKDTVKRSYTYTMFQPVFKTTAEVRANIKSNPSESIQQPGKLFIQGHYIFLNEVDKGIHVIDNSNPAQPRNVAFIDIPGNVDLAVKGNTLYADLYTDLITLDITNPLDVKVKSIVENVFPHRYYFGYYGVDSTKIITDWIKKDTTITEKFTAGAWKNFSGRPALFAETNGRFSADVSFAAAAKAAAPVGMGGSMARFTIVGERLYTVGNHELKTFNISNAEAPSFVAENEIGFGIETIYPFKGKLFIGSTSGMFIYAISNPDQPQKLSEFSHVRSCDPVIADDQNAYVTLRSGTLCMGFTNQLEVLDISNLLQPSLIKTYPMTNPHGLSKEDDLLFICDGADGLKVYDATLPGNLQLLKTIGGFETYDVIAYNNLALVVAKDGLYQFDYSDRNNIKQLSKITLGR